MTTATIWDEELGSDRPLTEEEIRKLQEDAFDNGDITVAEQEAAEAAFRAVVDSYVRIRSRIDPEWHSVPETDYEDADWDLLGGTLSVEWKEYDRCGDRDYFRRDFPLSDLWHPNWETLIAGERDRKAKAEKEAREAQEAKRKAEREAAERKQLRELLGKYGVPEEFQLRVSHG